MEVITKNVCISADPDTEGEQDDIVFNCNECGTAIIRNSKEHDECYSKDDGHWYCGDCNDDEEEDDNIEDCELCGYSHHYEDKCPIGTQCEKYEKWREEEEEEEEKPRYEVWLEMTDSAESISCEREFERTDDGLLLAEKYFDKLRFEYPQAFRVLLMDFEEHDFGIPLREYVKDDDEEDEE